MIKLKSLLNENDYNPDWDYEPHPNPPPKLVELVKRIIVDLKKLTSALKLGNIRVSYIINDGEESLARYISGTYENPYVVISIDNFSPSKNIGRDLEMTIVHELVHAYLESRGLDTSEHNEDVVEEAAIEYMDFRDPIDVINYINQSYPHL